MRHKLYRHRLNRFTSWRKATGISLVRSVLIYQSIKTTKARAAMVRPMLDKLINMAQVDSLVNKRKAFQLLGDHALVARLFGDIAKRFSGKTGGFTRTIQLGLRRGDSATMVILELTEIKKEPKRHKAKKEAGPQSDQGTTEHTHPHPEEGQGPEEPKKKTQTKVVTQEKPPSNKRPSKSFLGGLRGIFKKERDSL